MRMKGKKPIFNYKDCWSLDNVLSDVIYAGLVKFKEELVDHPFKGHPIDFCDENNEGSDEAFQEWVDALDKMIYAFDMSQEPDIGDYEFSFNYERGETKDGFVIHSHIEPTDKCEYNRYNEDLDTWAKKCKEGRELFAQYFHNLWI